MTVALFQFLEECSFEKDEDALRAEREYDLHTF
jgi:hypothetical protein